MQRAPKATLTGRSLDHPSGPYHEVVCVNTDCALAQFHPAGKAACILCGTEFLVQTIHLVEKPPAKVPDMEPPSGDINFTDKNPEG
jgi:hypothetical protein